jgi:hypothetical protein
MFVIWLHYCKLEIREFCNAGIELVIFYVMMRVWSLPLLYAVTLKM